MRRFKIPHLAAANLRPVVSAPQQYTVGTRFATARTERGHRFIPARARNTPCSWAWCAIGTVHPRTCGEYRGPLFHSFDSDGSSPRVRGIHAINSAQMHVKRFIPARAGNTQPQMLH